MFSSRLIALLFAALLLTACGDQSGFALTDMLNPPSAGEICARVEKLDANGKAMEALMAGENFLKSHVDPGGELHMVLARIYTANGDAASALRHHEMARAQGRAAERSAAIVAVPAIVRAAGTAALSSASAGVAAAIIGPNVK